MDLITKHYTLKEYEELIIKLSERDWYKKLYEEQVGKAEKDIEYLKSQIEIYHKERRKSLDLMLELNKSLQQKHFIELERLRYFHEK